MLTNARRGFMARLATLFGAGLLAGRSAEAKTETVGPDCEPIYLEAGKVPMIRLVDGDLVDLWCNGQWVRFKVMEQRSRMLPGNTAGQWRIEFQSLGPIPDPTTLA